MQFSGKLVPGRPMRIGILVSRFNELITSKLLEGATDALVRHGVAEGSIDVAWVPGAFELPLVAQRMLNTGRYDGLVALGCVIRGATPHFDFVAGEAVKGLASVSLAKGVPIGFGLLTTDTIEQAVERAGTKHGNKGADAAMSVIEQLNLFDEIDKSS